MMKWYLITFVVVAILFLYLLLVISNTLMILLENLIWQKRGRRRSRILMYDRSWLQVETFTWTNCLFYFFIGSCRCATLIYDLRTCWETIKFCEIFCCEYLIENYFRIETWYFPVWYFLYKRKYRKRNPYYRQ